VNEEQLHAALLGALADVAPDVDAAAIDPDADLAEELEIDSIDRLNLVVALHERIGVEIPERDYGRLSSVNATVAYLLAAQGAP